MFEISASDDKFVKKKLVRNKTKHIEYYHILKTLWSVHIIHFSFPNCMKGRVKGITFPAGFIFSEKRSDQ